MIKFDEELFTTLYKKEPPEYFHFQLRDLTITATRTKEAGARLIIGHYIAHAVLLGRLEFGLNRLVFDSEVDVEAVEVPRLGWLTGTLDFATAVVAGSGDIGLSHHVNDSDFLSA